MKKDSSNCTFMELKLPKFDCIANQTPCSNCTFMELK